MSALVETKNKPSKMENQVDAALIRAGIRGKVLAFQTEERLQKIQRHTFGEVGMGVIHARLADQAWRLPTEEELDSLFPGIVRHKRKPLPHDIATRSEIKYIGIDTLDVLVQTTREQLENVPFSPPKKEPIVTVVGNYLKLHDERLRSVEELTPFSL